MLDCKTVYCDNFAWSNSQNDFHRMTSSDLDLESTSLKTGPISPWIMSSHSSESHKDLIGRFLEILLAVRQTRV